MRFPYLSAALAAALLAVVPQAVQAQDYYQDIRPVLVDSCMSCHTEGGPAFSMSDAEETYRRRGRIARAVTNRVMPPWLAEGGHQAYVGDLSLADEVVERFQAWAEAGYPKGDAVADPAPAEHRPLHAFQAEKSLDVLPHGPYLPNQEAADDYRCFLVDWEGDSPEFVTGFRADPGNRGVAHHVVVYAVAPEMADRFRELETIEEGPGYTCFGGALPDRLFNRQVRAEYESRYPDGVRELNRANSWLAHWAPGMDGHVFPEGTGIPIRPGALLVVQMHYYSSTAPGESDAETRLDFRTAAEVERPAFHLAQTRGDWLGSTRNETMVIPPGTRRSYGISENLGEMLGYFAHLTGVPRDDIQALEIHSANLHMHSFGHSGRIYLTHETGQRETLLSVPRWDLRWQRDFTFQAPKVLGRETLEDSYLSVECTYENDTQDTVYGGYGSMEEMCFNFSYIAVRPGATAAPEGEAAPAHR